MYILAPHNTTTVKIYMAVKIILFLQKVKKMTQNTTYVMRSIQCKKALFQKYKQKKPIARKSKKIATRTMSFQFCQARKNADMKRIVRQCLMKIVF